MLALSGAMGIMSEFNSMLEGGVFKATKRQLVKLESKAQSKSKEYLKGPRKLPNLAIFPARSNSHQCQGSLI